MIDVLGEGGYTGAVTVSTELEFVRSLRLGDELKYVSFVESIGPEKTTGLGLGRFIGFRFEVKDSDDEIVGILRFTNLAYKPLLS